MITFNHIIKLDSYEEEDIFDVVLKLEKAFGLKFQKNTFYNVQTFGDMCDIFINDLHRDNSDDGTTQQAFYKIRHAIGTTQLIERNSITLDTKLQDIFPRNNRRKKIKELQKELNTTFTITDIKSWLGWTIFIGIVASLITFFIKWELAVAGLLFFIVAGWTASKFFANEFIPITIREFTKKLVTENYVDVRRNKATINRQEIQKIIIDAFSNDLNINKAYLTRNDKFSWAT